MLVLVELTPSLLIRMALCGNHGRLRIKRYDGGHLVLLSPTVERTKGETAVIEGWTVFERNPKKFGNIDKNIAKDNI